MKKKIILHSVNIRNMDAMVDYFKKKNFKKTYKLILIESNQKNKLLQKIKKLYYFYFSGYDAIVSDYPTILLSKGKRIKIAMGHGTSIKKFPSDEELRNKTKLNLAKNVKCADYYITTSERQNSLEYRNEILEKDSKNKYVSLGLPKNDYYFNKEKVKETNIRIRRKLNISEKDYVIQYAPTWRDYNSGNVAFNDVQLQNIDELLKRHNAYMIYRPHPLGGTLKTDIIEELKLERIFSEKQIAIDTFESLCISDALISDYSSISIQYLPLNRPILLFLYDQEEYAFKRGIEFDFADESINPGTVAINYYQLYNVFLELFEGEFNNDSWKNRRENCLRKHYTYPDGNASERIWKLILENI